MTSSDNSTVTVGVTQQAHKAPASKKNTVHTHCSLEMDNALMVGVAQQAHKSPASKFNTSHTALFKGIANG
jgi:hypothetical protein